MIPIHPVILSGGTGSRLWPLSRASYPKQLLPLIGENSMLRRTIERVMGLTSDAIATQAPIIVCNEEHRFLIREQCNASGYLPSAIYLEPVGRNTAPAITLAALHLANGEQPDPDALMLILPADHEIRDTIAFGRAIEHAARAAEHGYLVTFGINPTHAETGYGYIKSGQPLDDYPAASTVAAFIEKPTKRNAEMYVTSGEFSWNSGMFLFKASTFLAELEQYRPDILRSASLAWRRGTIDLGFHRIEKAAFVDCPSESIDYAIMQSTQRAAVVNANMGWSDVGSWDSLWEILDKDSHGNVLHGDVLALDTCNSYLRAENKLVAVLGLDGIIVVETKDAIVVADKKRAQDIKSLVDTLEESRRKERTEHMRIYRPWGWYESVDSGERFQVKRIMVRPGEKLSLQMHHHRAEHWVVVRGTAKVKIDTNEFILSENQSTYISAGQTHRLENPGKIDLHLIEIQSGAYLGEDDIVRFDDVYARS